MDFNEIKFNAIKSENLNVIEDYRKKINKYLLEHLPMTPDDKWNFVEEMNKKIY